MTNTPLTNAPCSPGGGRHDIVDTLTEAFARDPLYRWLFVEPATRHLALRDNFTAVTRAASTHGRLDTTPSGDGAAIWTEPGRSLFDDPTALLDVLTQWATPARIEVAGHAMTACSRHQPTDAAVLHVIGARHAGAGVGSLLVRRRLDELDRIGCTAYLESSNPRNHTFYDRHGFTPVGEVRLGGDGPVVTSMIRPPRRAVS